MRMGKQISKWVAQVEVGLVFRPCLQSMTFCLAFFQANANYVPWSSLTSVSGHLGSTFSTGGTGERLCFRLQPCSCCSSKPKAQNNLFVRDLPPCVTPCHVFGGGNIYGSTGNVVSALKCSCSSGGKVALLPDNHGVRQHPVFSPGNTSERIQLSFSVREVRA